MAAKRVEGVQIERSADEILALKADSLEAHALNQSAAVVYDLCDGQTPKAEMAKAVHSRTGLPADEEIVDLALAELVETGLVVVDAADNAAAVTRRSLIRRLSLTSAVAMMLPVVESVVVPSAADAAPGVSPVPTFTPVPVFTPVFVPRFAPTPTPVQF
jgi:hypothetical protein